jgi:hypothetical protein
MAGQAASIVDSAHVAVACAARMHHSCHSVTRVLRVGMLSPGVLPPDVNAMHRNGIEEAILTSELRVCLHEFLNLQQQPR